MTRKPEVVLGVVGAMMLALGVGAATSGLSTQQARTASPSTLTGSSTNSEGTSLAFARADHTHAITYTAPYAGAVSRSQAGKNGDEISLGDFGPFADGLNDDSVALLAACNAAVGRRLYIPKAIYRISVITVCNAEVMWFEAGAQLSIDSARSVTATNHVVSLGGDPATGAGTLIYGNDANFFANDNGFSFSKTPSSGSDDFFHIRRDIAGSTGIIIRNDDTTGSLTDSYIHMYGGPLTGVNQGSSMRLSAGNLLNGGGLVNIVAENDSAFSLIQQAQAPLDMYTANVRQFQIASVPSAVNYWQFKGGLAGSSVSLAPAGSDTNISVVYNTKGTGSHFFRTGVTSAFQFEVKDTAGATNRVTVTGSNGGNPTIGTSGGNLGVGVPMTLTAVLQAALGTPANGTIAYCSDCTVANPCAGAGTGALAKRLNGAWVCN